MKRKPVKGKLLEAAGKEFAEGIRKQAKKDRKKYRKTFVMERLNIMRSRQMKKIVSLQALIMAAETAESVTNAREQIFLESLKEWKKNPEYLKNKALRKAIDAHYRQAKKTIAIRQKQSTLRLLMAFLEKMIPTIPAIIKNPDFRQKEQDFLKIIPEISVLRKNPTREKILKVEARLKARKEKTEKEMKKIKKQLAKEDSKLEKLRQAAEKIIAETRRGKK